MDPYLTYQRLVAAETGAAQPVASYRHVHLSSRPLVLCAYRLAGDEGAPVAILYGQRPDAARLVVVGEPRNRSLRFQQLARLAADVESYLGPFWSRRVVPDDRGRPRLDPEGRPKLLAIDAPQLIVPNSGTADWLTTLARSTVWLRTDGDHPVDAALPRFGAHLTHLTSRRATGGSANIVAATELLDLHWVTGQTNVEDASLATLLSWIDPDWLDAAWFPAGTSVRGLNAVGAARLAEDLPSAGPVPDPTWDSSELEPAVAAYNQAVRAGVDPTTAIEAVSDAAADALAPAWAATWRAIELARAIPEAASVSDRWKLDRQAWTRHLVRVDAGRAWFRRFRTAIQAARLLAHSEAAAAELAADMAFDDQLVMARAVAAGTAIEGTVIERDDTNRQLGPSGRRTVIRPLIRLRPYDEGLQPVGTTLYWASNTSVELTLSDLANDGTITLTVTRGMRSPLPEVGDEVCLATFSRPKYYPDTLPTDVPWTHLLPAPPDEGAA
jgi:hypothetical protein